MPPPTSLAAFLANLASPGWQRPAADTVSTAMLARLSADLADGALGIGVLLGYAPATSPAEYLQVAGLAAEAGVPTFTHARDMIEIVPDAIIDGAEEIVRAASQTGAHMHFCHVNSTSGRHIARVLNLLSRAQAAGARVSTEAYPYGSGMTLSVPRSSRPSGSGSVGSRRPRSPTHRPARGSPARPGCAS